MEDNNPINLVPDLIRLLGIEDIKRAGKSISALSKEVESLSSLMKQDYTAYANGLKAVANASKQIKSNAGNLDMVNEKDRAVISGLMQDLNKLKKLYDELKKTKDAIPPISKAATDSVDSYKKKLKELTAEFNRASKSQDATYMQSLRQGITLVKTEIDALTGSLKASTTTFIQAKGSYNALDAELKALRIQLKNIPEAMEEGSAEVTQMKQRVLELDAALKKFDRELGQSYREVGQYAKGILEAKAALDKQKNSLTQQANALRNYQSNLTKGSQEHNKLQSELDQTEKELKQVNIQLNQFNQNNTTSITNLGKVGSSLKGVAVGMLALAGAASLQNLGQQVFDVGKKFESVRLAIDFASGGAAQGAKNWEFLSEISKRLGLNLESAATGFKQVLAAGSQAGIEGEEIRRIFESVATAGTAMGLAAQDQEGVFLALSQVISKGTVQAEELRGQIGERLPGAFDIAARALGKTTKELNKMLENGEVLSKDFLPKFATELQKTFGGALPEAMNSTEANLGRLKTTWQESLDDIFESNKSFINNMLQAATGFMLSLRKILGGEENQMKRAALSAAADYETAMIESLTKVAQKAKIANLDVNTAIDNTVAGSRKALEKSLQFAQNNLQTMEDYNKKALSTITPGATAARAIADANLKKNAKELRERILLIQAELAVLDKIAPKVTANISKLTKAEQDVTALGTIESLRKKIEELTKTRDKDANLTQKEADSYNTRIEAYQKQLDLLTKLNEGGEIKNINPSISIDPTIAEKSYEELNTLEFNLREKNLKRQQELQLQFLRETAVNEGQNREQITKETEQHEIRSLIEQLQLRRQYGQDTFDIEKQLTDKKVSLLDAEIKAVKETEDRKKEIREAARELEQQAEQAFYDITSNLLQGRIDKQNEQMNAQKESELAIAGDNTKARQEIEEKYQKKMSEMRKRQAQAEKNKALFDVAIATAIAVAKAVAASPTTFGLPFSAFALGSGAIQAAVIASRRIPEYYKGTRFSEEGFAWVDERGAELIEHNGRYMLGYGEGARLQYLPKGSKVYTAQETPEKVTEILNTKQITNNYLASENQIKKAQKERKFDELKIIADLSGNKKLIREISGLRKDIKNRPEYHSNITKEGIEYLKKQGNSITNYLDQILPNGKF